MCACLIFEQLKLHFWFQSKPSTLSLFNSQDLGLDLGLGGLGLGLGVRSLALALDVVSLTPSLSIRLYCTSFTNGRSFAHLSDMVQAVSHKSTRTGLRSSASSAYVMPRLRTKFGERAFSFAGLQAAWNNLPADLRAINDPHTFQKRPKTFSTSAFDIVCSSLIR